MFAKLFGRKAAGSSPSHADAKALESDANAELRRRKAHSEVSALQASGWVILPTRNQMSLIR